MKISKSQFIEYLRCDRFAALDDINHNKEQSFVVIDGIKYDSEEYYDIVDALSIELDEITVDHSNLEVMMPYFNEIEILVGNKMQKMFNYDVITSIETFKQQKLECTYEDSFLFSYVDVFQPKENSFNLCEVKAITTNTLWKIGKALTAEDKENNVSKDYKSIFKKCNDGVCRLRDELEGFSFENSILNEKTYMKKKAQLFDYQTNIGRIVLDLSFQRFIAEKVYDYQNCNYYLGILNSEYTFDGTYDNETPLYNTDHNGEDIVVLVDLTQITEAMQDKVQILLDNVIKRMEEGNASPVPLGKHCMRKKTRQCKYYDVCFKDIPKHHSIFTYIGNHHGFKDQNGEKHQTYDLVNNGVVNMTDIDDNLLNRHNNFIQKKCLVNDEEYIDKQLINSGLKSLKYPLYHLDFESFPVPLPRFKGEKCYMQSVFQYSIHIEKEPNKCDKDNDHYEFLATDHTDQRLALVEKMLKDIKDDDGSIIVYNQSFEKGRIKEFEHFFPQYKQQLKQLNNRIFDLMFLLKGSKNFYEALGYDMKDRIFPYYHKDLEGSFSIKKVLPIFSNLSYNNMDVANGNDAMLTYGKYKEYSEVERQHKIKALIEYCKQDTWAMVVILEGLRNKI